MKFKLTLSSNMTISMLIFALYFFPPYFARIGSMRNIYYVLASAISILFIIWFLLNRRKRGSYINYMFLLVTLFYCIILISTIINKGSLRALIAQTIIASGFCASCVYFFCKERCLASLKALVVWLEICVVINLVTIVLFPNGLYTIYGYNLNYSNPAYFLGHRNNAIEFLIPLLGCSSYLNLIEGRRGSKNYFFALVISALTAIFTWSGNEILCIFVVIACELLLLYRDKFPLLNIVLLYIGSAALSFLLIVMDFLAYVMPVLKTVLNKSYTLSTRYRFWERGIIAIGQKLWLGYGAEEASIKYMRIGHSNSCHNYFLDILYYGGVALISVMTLIIILLSRRVKKVNEFVKAKIAVFVFSYFVLWVATPIHMDQLFFMFGFFMITICLPWECVQKEKVRSNVRFKSIKIKKIKF